MRAVILALAATVAAPLFADGVTGADVFKARTSARAAALGEAHVALSSDVSAFSYNPAGLMHLKGPQLGFLHFDMVDSVGVEDLTYAHPLPKGVIGGRVLFRGQPDIANPLAQDPPVGANDLVLSLAGAFTPSQFVSGLPGLLAESQAGAQFKYLRSHLGKVDADAFALDLGLQAPLADGLRGGLAVLNLGPPIRFIEQSDPLPATLLGGVVRAFDPLWGNQLNVLADVEAPLQGRLRMHFGIEDWLGEGFAVRAGYMLDNERSLNGVSAGFGVRLNQEGLLFNFDYAFRPLYYEGFNSFDAQHLFGVLLGF